MSDSTQPTTAGQLGIVNLQKVVKFGVQIGTDLAADLKGGKITLTDVIALIPDFLQLPDLINHKQDIINEAQDLTFDETQLIVDSLAGVITSQQVTDTVHDALNFIVAIKNLIERFTEKKAA